MKPRMTLGVGGAALLCVLVASATAQTSADAKGPVASALPRLASFTTPVAAATLDRYRGGTQVHNDMTLTGTTAGNTAQHVETGSNTISAGAFAHMSGLPVVIQNSGANVLIQNAVILHLQME